MIKLTVQECHDIEDILAIKFNVDIKSVAVDGCVAFHYDRCYIFNDLRIIANVIEAVAIASALRQIDDIKKDGV